LYSRANTVTITIMSTAHATHRPRNLAPWGKLLPGDGRTRIDDLLALPDDGWRYELVEGMLVRVAGSGELASSIAATILIALGGFVRLHRLGVVTGADGVYMFPNAETGLLPDVGFYAAARRAHIVDRTKPIPFAPDLAVEVASPSQSAADLAAKAERYLRGGTRLVWIVWPEHQSIDVWRVGDTAPSRVLRPGDMLDGDAVVPGFSVPVTELFADPLG
jgi:Uma2 family endonuclease